MGRVGIFVRKQMKGRQSISRMAMINQGLLSITTLGRGQRAYIVIQIHIDFAAQAGKVLLLDRFIHVQVQGQVLKGRGIRL